jgi:hypothetical protein
MSTNAFPVDLTTTTTPLTTKGDILTSNGTSVSRFPVGTDGQSLLYSSSASSGLSWGNVGETQYYVHISSQSVSASASIASVTFSSIPSTYQHLQVRVYGNATGGLMFVRMNSDTTAANYYSNNWTTAHPTDVSTTGASSLQYDTAEAGCYILSAFANSTSFFQGFEMTFPHYNNTSRWKQLIRTPSILNNGTTQGAIYPIHTNARWKSTSAITSLTFALAATKTFSSGTVFSLYGVKS